MLLMRNIVLNSSVIVVMSLTIAAFSWQDGQAIGVTLAEMDEFPWTVMLLYSSNDTEITQNGCGGALINRNFVITAAHCVIDRQNRKRPLKFVRLREYNIYDDPDCMTMGQYKDCSETKIDSEPRNITIHPRYNVSDRNSYHDIALIEIDPTPPYSDFLQPICLPEPEMDKRMTYRNNVYISGWGRTDLFTRELGSNVLSPIKLKIVLSYIEPETCKGMLNSDDFELGSGQICASGKVRSNACGGYSGYPLMQHDSRRRFWVLVGITSIGTRLCDTEGVPGVYTNVREYLNWIKQNIGITGECSLNDFSPKK